MGRIAINGMGRIGRAVARIVLESPELELVAVNDIAGIATIAQLLRFDSLHGTLKETVTHDETHLIIGGHRVICTAFATPEEAPFETADIVLECTGEHLHAGLLERFNAPRVLLSSFARDALPTFVYGFNHTAFDGERLISGGSCTSNLLALIFQALETQWPIADAFVTSIHSYTADQNLLDVKGKSELRRIRSATQNILPVTTGAATNLVRLMPHFEGKIAGQGVRVPTADVSLMEIGVTFETAVTKEALNGFLEAKSRKELEGIIAIDSHYRVSTDFIGSRYAGIIAQDLTEVVSEHQARLFIWHDNEWGYAAMLVELAKYILQKEGKCS